MGSVEKRLLRSSLLPAVLVSKRFSIPSTLRKTSGVELPEVIYRIPAAHRG
jgi:hypothetical protein